MKMKKSAFIPKNEVAAMWFLLILNILLNVFLSYQKLSEHSLLLVHTLTMVVCSLFPAGALLRTCFYLKSWDMAKKAWCLLALGFTFWFYKELYQAVSQLAFGHTLSIPSLADAGWFIGFIPIFMSILFLLYGYHCTGFLYGHWAKYASLISLVSFLEILLMYKLLIHIVYSPALPLLHKFVLLMYPVSDLALLGVTFFLVLITSVLGKGLLSRPWKYLAVGFVLLSVSDILYSYYRWFNVYPLGSTLDIMKTSGYLFIALSAFYQKDLMERFQA